MTMKRNLLNTTALMLIVLSGKAMASPMSTNFLEIGITQLNYKKPTEKAGPAGSLTFTDAKMARAEMSFNLTNKKNIFDSKLKYRKDYLGFSSDYLSLDFNLEENSSFNDVHTMKSEKAFAVINPSFFTFSGDSFAVEMTENYIKMDNFFAYCTANDLEYDMASAEGIEYGCMTELSLYADKKEVPALLTFHSKYEDGDVMKLEAKMKGVEITESQVIDFAMDEAKMEVAGYDVVTGPGTGTCYKEAGDKVFDSTKIKKDCLNSLEMQIPKIVMEDNQEATKFFLEVENMKVANQRFFLQTPVIQFVDKESSVTTTGLNVACDKSDEVEVNDLHGVISECLREGEVKISNVYTSDEKDVWWKYKNILSGEFDPISIIQKRDLTASNVSFSLDDNNLVLRANVFKRMLGANMKFKVFMKGAVTHLVDKQQLIIDVSHIEVPVGWFKLKWKKFFMKLVRKALVGESIDVIEDRIIISL
jgi:hypothetical protein